MAWIPAALSAMQGIFAMAEKCSENADKAESFAIAKAWVESTFDRNKLSDSVKGSNGLMTARDAVRGLFKEAQSWRDIMSPEGKAVILKGLAELKAHCEKTKDSDAVKRVDHAVDMVNAADVGKSRDNSTVDEKQTNANLDGKATSNNNNNFVMG